MSTPNNTKPRGMQFDGSLDPNAHSERAQAAMKHVQKTQLPATPKPPKQLSKAFKGAPKI